MAETLAALGVTHVYGMPGGYTMKLFEAVAQTPGVDAVLAPLEQTAACMADMHGRLTGRPAVVSGQGAFVGGTGTFGIMEAALSGTPMVIITEMTDHGLPQHAATQSLTGDWGTVDLPAIMRAMCKYVTVATTANEAVHGVELAVHHAVSGRPGPAAVLCRLDGLYGDVDAGARPRVGDRVRARERAVAAPDGAALARIARELSTARRPVIVAGNGTHHHYEALAALATRAACPVVTTTKARGAIADTHPWAAGGLSIYGSPVAYAMLRQADYVLVLGSRLNPSDTMMESRNVFDPERQTIVQVDRIGDQLGHSIPVALGVEAELGAFLQALVPAVGVDERMADERWRNLEAVRAEVPDSPEQLHAPSSPLAPQRVAGVLNDYLGEHHRVVLDAGNNRIFNYRYLRMPEPGRLHICGGHLGMAWGPAAALAAGILRPDERTIAVAGDGGMQMSFHTLAFAREHELPITFVVMNNGVLGNVLDAQRNQRASVDLPKVDFAAVAAAFGLTATRVDSDRALAAALRDC